MQPLFFFLLLTLLSTTQTNKPPTNSEIHHIAFLKDKLFFMSKSQRRFGVLSLPNRQILTNYELNQEEIIIKVNTSQKTIILRKDRTKVHLFKLDQLDIEEINVEILFTHQHIIDLIQTEQDVYVLTEKDLRRYERKDEEKLEHPKHFITSARKRQFFRKIFLQNQEYLTLVLTRDQQLCIRRLYFNKTSQQNCLFNLSSQLTHIDRLGSSILVQSRNLNYVINENQTTYSFRAEVSQMDNRYIVIGSLSKTLDFQRKTFVQGMVVIGSDTQNEFWIKQKEGKLVLFHNELPILPLEVGTVTRSWISKEEAGIFYFLLQHGRNNFILYEIDYKNSWSAAIKWTFDDQEESQGEEL